jgi:hypothetical protein
LSPDVIDYKKKSLLRGVSSEDQIKKYNSDAQKHNEGIYWILGVARKLEEKREELLRLSHEYVKIENEGVKAYINKRNIVAFIIKGV